MKLLMILFCCVLLLLPAYAVELVTHAEVTESRLTTSQLRAIFSMRQTRWSDGQPIQVFVLPSDDPLHASFTRQFLKMFPYQLDAIWNRQRYSGIGSTPVIVNSATELQQLLLQTPGAIGYMPQELLSDGLKVVILYE